MAEAQTESPPKTKTVGLRNLMRRRAVLVHLPGGGCIRLGPGEIAEIPESHASSRECLRFCRDGILKVERAKTPTKDLSAEAAAGDAEAKDEGARRIAEKPAKGTKKAPASSKKTLGKTGDLEAGEEPSARSGLTAEEAKDKQEGGKGTKD